MVSSETALRSLATALVNPTGEVTSKAASVALTNVAFGMPILPWRGFGTFAMWPPWVFLPREALDYGDE
jgi:hypothetical protein